MCINELQKNSKGAAELLYRLEQLSAADQMEAAPLLEYGSAAELARDIKQLREYVRSLELSHIPRELIG